MERCQVHHRLKEQKNTLVVITSDRGLAGAYNTNILKLAEVRKAEYENLNNKVEIVTVGKKANGYFKYRNIEPKQNYEGITDEPNFENALEIMTPLVQEFYDGKTNQIEIVYTEYKSAMTQTALYKTVLPFEVEQIAKEIESVGGYTFEPSASQVLSNIIPKYTNDNNLLFITECFNIRACVTNESNESCYRERRRVN